MDRYRIAAFVVLALGIAGVVATQVTSLRKGFLGAAEEVLATSDQDYPAPDFTGITRWLNSEPLSIDELDGNVVLVDFWTYTCINCIRTIPHLQDLYARYRDFGLEIVGVHSPEFEFEKDEDNVAQAIEDYGVTWPVAMDNEMSTWHAYANNYWPHVYLIDRSGHVRFDYIGEGHDAAIEESIRALLAQEGTTLPVALGEEAESDASTPITPEIYLGPRRGTTQGFLANEGGYRPGSFFDYDPPAEETVAGTVPAGSFFLAGEWKAADERLVAGDGARLLLPFLARNVHLVAGVPEGTRGTIRVTLDGAPVRPGAAGEEVSGGSTTVDHEDLFDLVSLDGVEQHVLTLEVDAGISVYSFTFGS